MKKQARGIALIALGLLLILAAAGRLVVYEQEAAAAGESAQVLLQALTQQIEENRELDLYNTAVREETPEQMSQTTLQGHDLIGVLRVPGLGLELPVLDSWSYPLLKLAPCRYSGSVAGNDLILLGHNYKKHFAPLKQVKTGDKVEFQDVNGIVHSYTVAATQILKKTELDKLTRTDHALTIFTCTTGGQSRFVVRCDRVQ